jgi:hypothetical protein
VNQFIGRLTLGFFLVILSVSCARSKPFPEGKAEATLIPKSEGSSSGGGGSFGDESSLTILKWASEDLARQIRNSSPEVYVGLRQGWSQQRLSEVIQNVKPNWNSSEDYALPEVSRYGQRLMFDYGIEANGTPFITATRLFMDAYSHYEVNSRPKHEFYNTLEEVKLKLAHEAAHLMGLGLNKSTDMTEARSFAKALLATLDSDNIECVPTSAPPIEIYAPNEDKTLATIYSGWTKEELQRRTDEYLSKRSKAFVINRPSGRSAVPTNGRRTPPRDLSFPNAPTEVLDVSSGYITVFAPRSYDAKFDFPRIVKSIKTGVRDYGYTGGYFSWNLVDLRKSVLTDEGYKSSFDYKSPQMNSNFHDYLDFRVIRSSLSTYEIETYPPLQQENWNYYRSQGKARISIQLKDGQISAAQLTILKDFNAWLDGTAGKDLNLAVPLSCIRSFKPLEFGAGVDEGRQMTHAP